MFKSSMGFILQHLSMIVISMTDTLMLARLSSEHLSVVGLISHVYVFYFTFCYGLQMGASSLISKRNVRRSNGEPPHLESTLITLSLLLAIVGLFLIQILLTFLGSHNSLQVIAQEYLLFAQFSILPHFLFSAIKEILGAQLVIRPMVKIVIVGIVINFIGNYLFLFQMNMGARGAGLATLITRMMMLLMAFWVYQKYQRQPFQFGLKRSGLIFKSGLPSSFFILVRSGVLTLCAFLIKKQGLSQIAPHILTLNIATTFYVIYAGFSQYISIHTGQLLATHNHVSVFSGYLKALVQNCLLGFFLFTILFYFQSEIFSFLILDFEVTQQVGRVLPYLLIFFISDSIFWISHGALRSMCLVHRAPLASVLMYLLVILPSSYFLIPLGGFLFFWQLLAGATFFLGLITFYFAITQTHVLKEFFNENSCHS